MTWRTFSLLLLSVFFGQTVPSRNGLNPRSYTIHVPSVDQNPAYSSTAWVVELPAKSILTLFALGRQIASQESGLPIASSFAELVADPKNELVTNGGFSEDYGGQPAGLLLVASHIVHSFGKERTPRGSLRLSGLLCQSRTGALSILKTEDYSAAPRKILDRCFSAIQAGPILALEGRNGIEPSELTSRRAETRTVVALSESGRVSFVIFTRPIHLHAAAAFITAKERSARSKEVSQAWVDGRLRANVGLGLKSALNLDGSSSSVVAFRGTTIVGDPRRLLPSAIAVRF